MNSVHRGKRAKSVHSCKSIAALLGLFLSSSALANDGELTLAAGGLVARQKASTLTIASEDLNISVGRIETRYQIRNSSDEAVDVVVAFALPALSGEEVYDGSLSLPDENKLNFVDFEATAGGYPVPMQAENQAFVRLQDITARLQAAGLKEPDVMPEMLNAALLKLAPDKRAQLEHEGLIIPVDYNPALRRTGIRRGWRAAWTLQTRYYWTQHFPARQTVELIQEYRPVVGGSYLYAKHPAPGRSAVESYCGGEEALDAVSQVIVPTPGRKDTAIDWWEKKIDYNLSQSSNWNAPIEHFHLSMTSDSPDDIVLSCMPGLKRTAPQRYELERAGFQPDRDLKLLLLQRNR